MEIIDSITAQLTYFKDARSFVALNVTILSVRDMSFFLLSYVAFSIGPQSSSSWQRRNRQLSNKKNMFNIILQDSHLLQLRQSELKLLRMT